ncbi:PTS sugar transporter subunit IIA [Desulfogranum mediterraneum]|uniref:PTS sugar transporter subunit IIA n=1 Tax=Desulfogranum mediterraneum TaxID=160661 RepID=UPI000404AFEF|nr:PTS sugar transporter subunit IIA [Desulfogranum mediterraneum]
MLLFNKESILLDMEATAKEAALRELAQLAADQYPSLDSQTLYTILQEREQIGSTGVGNGVAIPHGKVEHLPGIILLFARSRQGVSFDAIDKRPVYLFALLLAPADIAGEYLRALAHVSTILKEPENRHRLQSCSSTDEILRLFDHSG